MAGKPQGVRKCAICARQHVPGHCPDSGPALASLGPVYWFRPQSKDQYCSRCHILVIEGQLMACNGMRGRKICCNCFDNSGTDKRAPKVSQNIRH